MTPAMTPTELNSVMKLGSMTQGLRVSRLSSREFSQHSDVRHFDWETRYRQHE